MLRLVYLVSFGNTRMAKIKVSKDIFSYKRDRFDGERITEIITWCAIPKEKFLYIKFTSHPIPAAMSE